MFPLHLERNVRILPTKYSVTHKGTLSTLSKTVATARRALVQYVKVRPCASGEIVSFV